MSSRRTPYLLQMAIPSPATLNIGRLPGEGSRAIRGVWPTMRRVCHQFVQAALHSPTVLLACRNLQEEAASPGSALHGLSMRSLCRGRGNHASFGGWWSSIRYQHFRALTEHFSFRSCFSGVSLLLHRRERPLRHAVLHGLLRFGCHPTPPLPLVRRPSFAAFPRRLEADVVRPLERQPRPRLVGRGELER